MWDATAKPEGVPDSLQTHFRLSLASPARSAQPGTRIQGTISRSDNEPMHFWLILLSETFEPPSVAPQSGSGALTAIAVDPEDSVRFTLTVSDRGKHEPWMALAELHNGGRFLLAIDSAAGWGELRSEGVEYHMKVLNAIAGLSARQQ
jgi:hypothetical protein